MLVELVVRIVLAMHLALWTPAMCCCAFKAAMAQATGAQVADCPKDCCARVMQQSETCDTGGPAHDEHECKCHEKMTDRLDTGAKILVPALTAAAMLVLPTFEAGESSNHSQAITLRSVMPRAHPPPSLLALHCLLII